MALEIERRFLVHGDEWRQHITGRAHLLQGYLVSGPGGLTLRVRSSRAEDALGGEPAEAWLTLKAPLAAGGASGLPGEVPGQPDGLVRQEFEYAIPLADAQALLALAPFQIRKWRYHLALPGGDWVVDVFEAANAPLVLAEVELASADQLPPLPPWCAQEVTGRHELSNAALAREPLQAWSPERRRSLPHWLHRGAVASDTINRLS
ncbi:CYTH domain-containing protein [Cyanobium sp. LEGE 06143]|uniref:CYTH domain-containing protein n=1 Tax=Cyanobium sp. LEGE 06143 TaxID=945727 RepID=UPI00187F025E|nr:CYTH domain-containing protein [Cyanobium sp. LEGE 06143]MBE9172927.1 CYTH domain-containing protein [Cyanobium sp. LEGE 06143]